MQDVLTTTNCKYLRYPLFKIIHMLNITARKATELSIFNNINHDFSINSLVLHCYLLSHDKWNYSIEWSLYDDNPYILYLNILEHAISLGLITSNPDEETSLVSIEELSQLASSTSHSNVSSFGLEDVVDHWLCIDTLMFIKTRPSEWRWSNDIFMCVSAVHRSVDTAVMMRTRLPNFDKFVDAVRASIDMTSRKRYLCLDDLTYKNTTTISKYKYVSHTSKICSSDHMLMSSIAHVISDITLISRVLPERRKPKPKTNTTPHPTPPSDQVEKTERKTASTRARIPSSVRAMVWRKYSDSLTSKCFVCRCEIKYEAWQCSHWVSAANGGSDSCDNLYPCCIQCNLSMGSTNMDEYIRRYFPDRFAEVKSTCIHPRESDR